MVVPESLAVEPSALSLLTQIAEDAGAADLAREASELRARVGSGLFYVACVGQFKRGKSSLINALLGEPILPVGVAPVTAVVTVLRYGPDRRARVRLAGEGWRDIDPPELASFVAEDLNPENRKGVTAVEVHLPSPLLESGMCLVDTPGIGSVFAGNTETTRAFVPHIDAAIVVLGGDPPVSADELALIETVAGQCPDLLIVLNKADRLSEADRQDSAEFTAKVLAKRLGRNPGPLLEVSAAERLAGATDSRDWPVLTEALTSLARKSRDALVHSAAKRGSARLASKLRRFLDEERGALVRPVAESERRVAALRDTVAEAERSLNDLGHLFQAEHERLARIFEGQKAAFILRTTPVAQRELAEALSQEAVPKLALRTRAVDLAHDIARARLDGWLAEANPAAEALYVEATRRFVDLANDFLTRLASVGDGILAGLPGLVAPETGFRAQSRLFYTSLMTLTGQTPLRWFLDLVGPRRWTLQRVASETGDYLERILTANANRIANDLDDRVLESRRRLQAEIRSHIGAVSATAEEALARAKARHAEGRQAVEAEVSRIDALMARLAALEQRPDCG